MTKTPKDDGTRSGRMEGPRLPRVQKSQGMTLEEAAKLPPIPDDIAERFTATSVVRGHVGVRLDNAPVIYGIDFETHSEMPLLYPYQREMLRDIMTTTPEFEKPVEGDTYEAFKDRYSKMASPTGRRVGKHPALGAPYGGKMRDYMRQHSYFASGDADPLAAAKGRRFYALGGGEGNRQMAYYRYGMAVQDHNWIDDVYDRRQRRAEAELRRYCMADVMIFGDYAKIEMRILLTLLNNGFPPCDHLLKAPYGREASSVDWGIAISIRFTGLRPRRFVQDDPVPEWPDRQLADMIGGAVTGFGCPEFISRKVAETMFASGRYDCCVTLSKHALRNLREVMSELRCEVIVVCDDRRGWMEFGYAPDSDRDIR